MTAATAGLDGKDADSIRVSTEGSTVMIAVEHRLDAVAGQSLLRAALDAIDAQAPDRVEIDLRALDDYDDDGAAALAACGSLGARLPEGLHYRTGRGPGREALLVAYQAIDETGEPEALGGTA